MKFFMAQNEDGELKIASSSNNTTMDDLGWYEIQSAQNFKEIDNSKELKLNEPKLTLNTGDITQLIVPYWVDSREKEHFPNCYFLYSSGRAYFTNKISEIFPISYNNGKIKEVYRTIALSDNINYEQRLQYVDYSDKVNITTLINYKPNNKILYFDKIIVADETNQDNLNKVLLEQDLFFQLKIRQQGYSKKIQFDIKIMGLEGSAFDQETELVSERLFYIITNKNDIGTEITFSKIFPISKFINKYYKITKIIVEKSTSITTDDNSYLTSFNCYLPYFTWVNTTIQAKNFSGIYLKE